MIISRILSHHFESQWETPPFTCEHIEGKSGSWHIICHIWYWPLGALGNTHLQNPFPIENSVDVLERCLLVRCLKFFPVLVQRLLKWLSKFSACRMQAVNPGTIEWFPSTEPGRIPWALLAVAAIPPTKNKQKVFPSLLSEKKWQRSRLTLDDRNGSWLLAPQIHKPMEHHQPLIQLLVKTSPPSLNGKHRKSKEQVNFSFYEVSICCRTTQDRMSTVGQGQLQPYLKYFLTPRHWSLS